MFRSLTSSLLRPIKPTLLSRPLSSEIRRAYPEYKIFGETAMLKLKPIFPIFKRSGVDGCVVDRAGKMLIEMTPRTGGVFKWDETTNFALSPEECGLVITQLPTQAVELTRQSNANNPGFFGGNDNDTNKPVYDKVLQIVPGESLSVVFSLEYVDPETGMNGGGIGPLTNVHLQAGEYAVVSEILRSSITHLIGFEAAYAKGNQFALATAHPGNARPSNY